MISRVLVLTAVLCVSPAANAVEKFMTIDFPELIRRQSALSAEARTELERFRKGSPDQVRARYLIASTDIQGARDWMIVREPCGAGQYQEHIQLVHIPELLRTEMRKLFAEGKFSNTRDLVVLEGDDIESLIRITWLNRDSTSPYSVAEVTKRFNLEFLQNVSRRWFFRSAEEEPLLVISGLATSAARVYVCLHDQNGATPFFEISGGPQATLMEAISLLRAEEFPAELSLSLNPKGVDNKSDFRLDNLRVNFILPKGPGKPEKSIPAVYKENPSLNDLTVRVKVSADRQILSASEVEFRLVTSDWLFVQEDRLSDSVKFTLPKPGDVIQTGSATYKVDVAKPLAAEGFQSDSIWHSSVRLPQGDVSRLIEDYRWRFRDDISQIADLFKDPQAFLKRFRRYRWRRPGREEEKLIGSVDRTQALRKAMLRQVEIGLSMANNKAQILLIKNSGGHSTSIRTRDNIERGFSLVRAFLESELSKKNIPVLISERRAADSSQAGVIDIFVLPSTGSDEALEEVSQDQDGEKVVGEQHVEPFI